MAITRLFIYSHGSTSISFVSYQHLLTYAQPPAFYNRRSLYDYAGSGVVHLTGGTAAFVGATPGSSSVTALFRLTRPTTRQRLPGTVTGGPRDPHHVFRLHW